MVQIRFSKSGKYMGSVSKDRCLAVYMRSEEGGQMQKYVLIEKS